MTTGYILCAAFALCAVFIFAAVIINVRSNAPAEPEIDDGALEGDLRAYVGHLNGGQG